MIAHRLSTIKKADRIVVLKKGKLVEDGTHESLLREYPNGTYAKLAKTQEAIEAEDEGGLDTNYNSAIDAPPAINVPQGAMSLNNPAEGAAPVTDFGKKGEGADVIVGQPV